jgi:hypothetical protein
MPPGRCCERLHYLAELLLCATAPSTKRSSPATALAKWDADLSHVFTMEPQRVVRALFEVVAEILFLLNRILFEEAGNEGGVEIRSDLNDRPIHKSTYPAIPVIEPEPILSGGLGMQLDHRPVTTYERMFHM